MDEKQHSNNILLNISNLQTYFYTEEGISRAVDGVDYYVKKGETLGVVGESGCGKSVTALSVMRLIPQPPGKIVGGDITFEGKSLLGLSNNEMRKIRGNKISMIFQEPMTSLNPVFTIGNQISEAIQLHQGLSKKAALDRSVEMLKLVGISSPEQRVKEYPHQLSGGMRQRAMIAMALSCNPSLLIADEPTTALDVTIQAQILDLFKEMRADRSMSILFITHDLGIVADIADRVAVMYAGRIVDTGPADAVLASPIHPYTRGLVDSVPDIGMRRDEFRTIPGRVPAPEEARDIPGCMFAPRCHRADGACSSVPALSEFGSARYCACFHPLKPEGEVDHA